MLAKAGRTLDEVKLVVPHQANLRINEKVAEVAKIGTDPSWATEDGKICWNADGDAVFNFGKEKGQRLVDAKGFARWVIGKDFASDVKDLCTRALRGEQVRKQEEEK